MSPKHNPIIGITLGDINGVGPEVIIKALNDTRMFNFATLVVYGSAKTISYYRKHLKMEDFNFHQVRGENQFGKKKVNPKKQ